MKKNIGILVVGVMLFSLSACSVDPSISYGYGREDYAKQDYKDAFHHFMEAAKWRNANAQYAVAYMYYYGIGVEQNLPEAMYWMKKSAESGNKTAQAVLPALNAQVPNLLFMDDKMAAQYSSGNVAAPIHMNKAVKPAKKLKIASPFIPSKAAT